jgi:Zn-dependent protease
VAAAGPISNFILALFFVLIMGFLIATNQGSEATYNILKTAAFMNIFLAVLNLLPIPPLDGSKVFLDILKNYSSRLFIQIPRLFNKYQFIIFFVLLLFIFYTNFLIIVSQ